MNLQVGRRVHCFPLAGFTGRALQAFQEHFTDWLYRDTSNHGRFTHFLNAEGCELKSQTEAREQIFSKYSSGHHLDFFNRFVRAKLRTMTVKGYTWRTSSTVPEGWRVRRTAGGKNERLLSPQGEEVKSRRAAVQLLISTKAPTEKVFVCFYFHSYLIFDPLKRWQR